MELPWSDTKKNVEFACLRCLCEYRDHLRESLTNAALFARPPIVDFFPHEVVCPQDRSSLLVLKTTTRTVKTLHIGAFTARETIRMCPRCGARYRSQDLSQLIPPSCNFGYDVLVYVGKALFVDHLADQTIMDALDARNVPISPSEIAYLGKKFIGYLTRAPRNSAARLQEAMAMRGGYILHVDATYEKNSPLLMSGLDSILHIVLGNCKLPSENSDDIIPFLKDIRTLFGEPLAVAMTCRQRL